MDFKVALLQQKKMLRKEVLSKRRAYNQNELAIQSNNICQKIIKMPFFESSLNIMVYLAMADEVNIDNLIKDCLNKCKLVVVPEVVDETGIMNGAILNDWQDLRIGSFGIRSVKDDNKEYIAPDKLEVIIVPAVAYNNYGARLGMGRGFYDRFLAQCPQAIKIGVALSCQIITEIPSEEHDILVDYVVTTDGIVNCKTGKMC